MMDDRWAVPTPGERVQHCNSRTEYEMIVHPYAPGGDCDECDRIAGNIAAANRREPVKVPPAPSSSPCLPLAGGLDSGMVVALGACGHWWQEPAGEPARHPFAGEVVRLEVEA